MTDIFEIAIQNAMNFLMNNEELSLFIKNYHGSLMMPESDDARRLINIIGQALNSDGHSGASFSVCLSACKQRLLQDDAKQSQNDSKEND